MFFGAVLALSFLLLMVVFRSLLVPLKAVVMNLLSIGAAYGVVVAVFQWGWGGRVLGIERGADRAVHADDAVRHRVRPVDGLRGVPALADQGGVRPHRRQPPVGGRRPGRHRPGHHRGRRRSWSFVFGSFLLETDRVIKLFGLGLAIAVLLDATIVRMLLVPATMELLGDRNWWLPRWLDRILPHIDVEGRRPPGDAERSSDEPPSRELEPTSQRAATEGREDLGVGRLGEVVVPEADGLQVARAEHGDDLVGHEAEVVGRVGRRHGHGQHRPATRPS